MIARATAALLRRHAKELLGNDWDPEREKELIREALTGFELEAGHRSHSEAAHLARLDAILGTYGVEGIFQWKAGGSVDVINYDPDEVLDVQYCNAGDTYALTLLYWRGKLCVGDWGTIVEQASGA